MMRRWATLSLAVATSLALGVPAAHAAGENAPPQSGFGSKSEPMTLHQASGGFIAPIVRVFNPCAHFGDEAYHRMTPIRAILDDNRVFPELRYEGRDYRVWLKCSKANIQPFGGLNFLATCTQRGHIIKGSWGFSHQFGPVILPVANVLSRDNSSWQYDFSLFNIGWVPSDTTIWWLCNEGTQ